MNTQHDPADLNPTSMIRPGRKITGMSAILLPFDSSGAVAWNDFDAHVHRTFDAGLSPAINMDTGYANLIDESTRTEALGRTQSIAEGREFIAGVFVDSKPGDRFDADRYRSGSLQVQDFGGTPIFFQSFGLTAGSDDDILDRYLTLAKDCDSFLAFELGTMFAPFGKIYSLDLYQRLIQIPKCKGAKHSSLRRDLEWRRLQVRDATRPEFLVLTGNDLAIDMVMYGSDYLLGLSTFSPEAFARRDAMWQSGDTDFYHLNDLLQYLGTFAFRGPVPAYKHSAAQFLHLRGMLETSLTHPDSPGRPDSDVAVLQQIADQLASFLD